MTKNFIINVILMFIILALLSFCYYWKATSLKTKTLYHNTEEYNDKIINQEEKAVKDENEINRWIEKQEINETFLDNCISLNEDLSKEEKEIFLKSIRVMKEYSQTNEDLKRMCHHLYMVDVVYDYKNNNQGIMGNYDNDKTITLYPGIYEDRYEAVLGHEIFHLLSYQENLNQVGFYNIKTNIGLSLNEGMTQLLTEEYMNDIIGITYKKEVIVVKILIELLDSDKVLNSYFTGDFSIVEDAFITKYSKQEWEQFLNFTENMGNKERRQEFVQLVESISSEEQEKTFDYYLDVLEEKATSQTYYFYYNEQLK